MTARAGIYFSPTLLKRALQHQLRRQARACRILARQGSQEIANMLANRIADHVDRSRIMSPQETQTLQQFLTQLVQVRGIVRDRQADAMIAGAVARRSEEHTSELQSHSDLVCRLLLEKKK